MKVWMVSVSDCESSHTICICATKEIALREMFKKRDALILVWKAAKILQDASEKRFLEEQAKAGVHYGFCSGEENMYDRMVRNLSNDDYEHWENYPQEVPWIHETEIIDE